MSGGCGGPSITLAPEGRDGVPEQAGQQEILPQQRRSRFLRKILSIHLEKPCVGTGAHMLAYHTHPCTHSAHTIVKCAPSPLLLSEQLSVLPLSSSTEVAVAKVTGCLLWVPLAALQRKSWAGEHTHLQS